MTEHPEAVTVRVYPDGENHWRWTVLAGNNETVADSGEGYVNHADALAAAKSLFPHAQVEDER